MSAEYVQASRIFCAGQQRNAKQGVCVNIGSRSERWEPIVEGGRVAPPSAPVVSYDTTQAGVGGQGAAFGAVMVAMAIAPPLIVGTIAALASPKGKRLRNGAIGAGIVVGLGVVAGMMSR